MNIIKTFSFIIILSSLLFSFSAFSEGWGTASSSAAEGQALTQAATKKSDWGKKEEVAKKTGTGGWGQKSGDYEPAPSAEIEEEVAEETDEIIEAAEEQEAEAGGQDSNPDNGDFKVTYEKPKSARLQKIYSSVVESKAYSAVITGMNETIALPKDIPISFKECGVENAFYDPGNSSITMCYEILDLIGRAFDKSSDGSADSKERDLHIYNAGVFILFHEIGHSLIDLLDIPATGKEEDAVDDLATIVLLESGDDGAEAALSAMGHFGTMADIIENNAESFDDLAFWDEHSVDSQRFYGIACLVYGSDPQAFADMVGEDSLPSARAERCPYEFQQKSRAWGRLLYASIK